MKIKYLQTINLLREKFGVSSLPKKFTRTVSFRIFPKKEDEKILDHWFDEISEIKFLHFENIFQRFKKGKLNFFSLKKIDYKSLYKGENLWTELKKQYKVLCAKTEEGIRTETQGILNSFHSNTRRIFEENRKNLEKIIQGLKKLEDIGVIISDEEKELFSRLFSIKFPFKNFEEWELAKELTKRVIQTISRINFEINQINVKRRAKIQPILNLRNLPQFPLVEKFSTLSDFKNRFALFEVNTIKEKAKNLLSDFEKKYIHADFKEEKVIHYLLEKGQKLRKKIAYYEKIPRASRLFRLRFFNWYLSSSPSITQIINGLKRRLEKERKHFLSRPFDREGKRAFFNTLFLLCEILYISQFDPKKREIKQREVNEEITRIKSLFLKGKPVKDTFLISGFSWGKKPLKAGALFLDEKNGKKKLGLVLSLKNSAYQFNMSKAPQIKFLVLTGGSRKKAQYSPKKMEVKNGYFDKKKDEYALSFLLYQGKSYLRRFLFHREWGFLNQNQTNKFFPANARVKRIRRNPGDPFEYYVDISFKYEGDSSVLQLDKKIENFIGIDRGEKYPLAYAIVNREGEILEKGILGKEFSEKLHELDSLRRKGKRIREKIRRYQETLIHQIVGRILYLLAKYPGLIILERLPPQFGRERRLIPKRTYQKVEKFLINTIEFANLPRTIIQKVNPKDTSVICPNCKFNFNEKKQDILSQFQEFFQKGELKIEKETIIFPNGLKILLPPFWLFYSSDEEYPSKIKLEELKQRIEVKNYDEAIELFKKLTPRYSQEKFKCLVCGTEEEADVVGAINIARRGLENFLKKYPLDNSFANS